MYIKQYGFPINKKLISYVLREDLDDFISDIFDFRIQPIQEFRWKILHWFAALLPEVFDEEFRSYILSLEKKYLVKCDGFFESMNMIPLQMLNFLLSRKKKQDVGFALRFYTNEMRCIRDYSYISLFFSMPFINVDFDMINRMNYNFTRNFFSLEKCVFLIALSKDTPEFKTNIFKQCYEFLQGKSIYCDILKNPAEGRIIDNPFYLTLIARIDAYVAGRLSGAYKYFLKKSEENIKPDNEQLTIPMETDDSPDQFLENDDKLMELYIKRKEEHPGLKEYVCLKSLA